MTWATGRASTPTRREVTRHEHVTAAGLGATAKVAPVVVAGAEDMRTSTNGAPAQSPTAVGPWRALEATHDLPGFPVDARPAAVRDWVTATALATQTPVDLAACAALGVLSACVAGTMRVDVGGRWEEECCLYIVCALESGDRKSAVLRAATAPLRAIEQLRVRDAQSAVAQARCERDAIEQRQKSLTARAAQAVGRPSVALANVTRAVYVREVADARRRTSRRSRVTAEYGSALEAAATPIEPAATAIARANVRPLRDAS